MTNKFLIIQTAFIGDVILATAVIEKLHKYFPESKIDFLLRKGNENLLINHPYLNEIIVWAKKKNKYKNLFQVIFKIRKNKYDYIINLQRFSSTGLITVLSGAKQKIGFHNNPFSFLFTKKIHHKFEINIHEVNRNLLLITEITDNKFTKPKLYPLQTHYQNVKQYKTQEYICISPTSVWWTKQFPEDKWIEFINLVPEKYSIYLIGSPEDKTACNRIITNSKNKNTVNLCEKLNLLESAALMLDAKMNFVNDSAPLHLASAMNAPTTAIFCSTIPDFGFGPLSDNSNIIETTKTLDCRPCGIHGKKLCPVNTFECAYSIDIQGLIKIINN
ncbi:MAG: glycosyltransferase family 9 protein [Bacteroidales bacterium]|nr:glycosyltransferase family 9 protein [Bacteroidales bacterium]